MAAPVELPVPAPDVLLLPWFPATVAEEARQRHAVATRLDDVIFFCETAIAKLRAAATTLLREPGDAAETIYDDVFAVVPPGLDPPLLGPAARLVDALFNGPRPLAGAIVVAGDLVSETFDFPPPDGSGGPLQAALRDLAYLIHVHHANAGHLFTAYATNIGVLPGDTGQRWIANHDLALARAKVALKKLNSAVRLSLAADVAIRLCQGEWEERLPPWERMLAAELMLQQTISRVNGALVRLRLMRVNLVELEQIVIAATGQAPPPP